MGWSEHLNICRFVSICLLFVQNRFRFFKILIYFLCIYVNIFFFVLPPPTLHTSFPSVSFLLKKKIIEFCIYLSFSVNLKAITRTLQTFHVFFIFPFSCRFTMIFQNLPFNLNAVLDILIIFAFRICRWCVCIMWSSKIQSYLSYVSTSSHNICNSFR